MSDMATSDWLIAGVRVFIVISMFAGARRAWRARREAGYATSVAGTAVTAIAMLLYLTGAVVLFTSYGVWIYPRQVLLFAALAVGYLWGGLWIIGNIAAAFEKRAMRQRGKPA